MSPGMVGFLGMLALLVLLGAGMPIGFALGLLGFLGYGMVAGWGAAFGVLGIDPYSRASDFILSAIPMFLLMGHFAHHSGISHDIFTTAQHWLGRLPGGLALATIAGCAGFAATSGSSVATAAIMGSISLPQMRRFKYDPKLATGVVAAGGTLGILIPPSIPMVLYGLITETSIGELLIAGILPGIMLAGIFMLQVYWMARRNPLLAPRGDPVSWGVRWRSLIGVWGILVLFLLVIGGIYGGVFTPTEAAAVGAFGAFLIAALRRRLTRQAVSATVLETGRTTAMIFAIIIGAVIFSYFLGITRLPANLAEFLSSLPVSRYVVVSTIIALYIPLGMFIEVIGMMLLTLPIFFPIVVALGFSPVWFGVIVVIMMELGLITPPVGINVFVVSGIAKDVPMWDVFRGIAPFTLGMVLAVAILLLFPQIALFLPGLMR